MQTYIVHSHEVLSGLAAATWGSDPEYNPCGEMTFESPNMQVARAFVQAFNAIEASTWSDCVTYLSWEPQVVDGPCEDHMSWQEIQADRSLCQEMAFYPQSTAVA